MNWSEKILSTFLLLVYLIVVWVQVVNPLHNSKIDTTSTSDTHQHAQKGDIHHDHLFHIGIFHFLGHITDIIKNADQQADDHVIMGAKYANSKVVNHASLDYAFANLKHDQVSTVASESLSDPPEALSILYSTLRANNPLRAPPHV